MSDIEKELVQQNREEALKELTNERDMLIEGATRTYDTLYTKLRPLAHHPAMSRRGLMRVLLALCEVPIKTNNKHLSPLEMQMFVICDRLLQAKFMLEHLVLAEPPTNEQPQPETVTPVEAETNVVTESENKNG